MGVRPVGRSRMNDPYSLSNRLGRQPGSHQAGSASFGSSSVGRNGRPIQNRGFFALTNSWTMAARLQPSTNCIA